MGRRDRRPALREYLKTAYDAKSVALVDSGTHALELALRVAAAIAGNRAGIALPAYACFDLATAAVATGLPLTLYDVVPETLAPEPESLIAAMRAGAHIVVIAPLYGLAAPWDDLRAAATQTGAVLVEDAAQGIGSSWRGARAGCQADLSVLSFGRGKGWTGGNGGALLARGAAAGILDEFVTHGMPSPQPSFLTLGRAAAMSAFVHPSVFALAAAIPWLHLGETRYHAPSPPRGLSRAAASLLLASSDRSAVEAEERRAAAAWYRHELTGAPMAAPVAPIPDSDGGYLRYPVRVSQGMTGFRNADHARALGIAAGYPTPLGELLPVRARLMPAAQNCRWPGAEKLCHQLITLPTHSLATLDDRRRVVGMLKGYARQSTPSRGAYSDA
jgi:dTDP-4-amino-4,6-dideoxygalactose transaminase